MVKNIILIIFFTSLVITFLFSDTDIKYTYLLAELTVLVTLWLLHKSFVWFIEKDKD